MTPRRTHPKRHYYNNIYIPISYGYDTHKHRTAISITIYKLLWSSTTQSECCLSLLLFIIFFSKTAPGPNEIGESYRARNRTYNIQRHRIRTVFYILYFILVPVITLISHTHRMCGSYFDEIDCPLRFH